MWQEKYIQIFICLKKIYAIRHSKIIEIEVIIKEMILNTVRENIPVD